MNKATKMCQAWWLAIPTLHCNVVSKLFIGPYHAGSTILNTNCICISPNTHISCVALITIRVGVGIAKEG